MANISPLGPGQSPPIAVITPNDQRGVLLVTTGLAIAFTLVSLVIRGYVRAGVSNNLGKDDVAITVAWVFLVAQSIAVIIATSHGFGQTAQIPSDKQTSSIRKALIAADILYVLAVWTSRISSTLFLLRISRTTRHEWVSTILLAAASILTLGSILTLAIQRTPTGLFDRWIAVTVVDVLFEIAIFLVPLMTVGGLQMALKTRISILAAFSSRLVAIIPLSLHLASVRLFTNDPSGSSYTQATPYMYESIVIAYLIIAASIPSLRPFMTVTATTFGVVSGSGSASLTTSKTRRGGQSIQSRPIPLLTRSKNGLSKEGTVMDRGETQHSSLIGAGHTATVSRHNRGSVRDPSIGSDISQRPIIRYDVQYNVSYQDVE